MADVTVIWQWNCRSFGRKRQAPPLELIIQNSQIRPDVIALQETGVAVKISGYTAYNEITSAGTTPVTALMVHRNLTANQLELENVNIPHIMVQILPQKRSDHPLYVLNIYSPPKDKSQATAKLFGKALKVAQRAPRRY